MLSIVCAKDWKIFKVCKEKVYESLGEVLGILLINFNLLGKTYFKIKKKFNNEIFLSRNGK